MGLSNIAATPKGGILLSVSVVTVISVLVWRKLATNSSFSKQSTQNRSSGCKKKKLMSQQEYWISKSIQESMPPAVKMGIDINHVSSDGSILSLSMPLEGNTNIHGTAFAGSLYSVAALGAWYTLVHHLRVHHRRYHGAGADDDDDAEEAALQQQEQQQEQQQQYHVVLKSAEIFYKRPVTCETIVAASVLPSTLEMDHFRQTLMDKGKATLEIKGTISTDEDNDDDNDKHDKGGKDSAGVLVKDETICRIYHRLVCFQEIIIIT